MMQYYDIHNTPLTPYACAMIDEYGGFPKKYAKRISILTVSTGDEERRNPVIELALDGQPVGCLLALFNYHISYRGKEGTPWLSINPDNKHVKRSRSGKETFFGKEIELYGDAIAMRSLTELFDFYEAHKVELSESKE